MSTQVFANIMTRAVYYARKIIFKSIFTMIEMQDVFVYSCLNRKCLEVWRVLWV